MRMKVSTKKFLVAITFLCAVICGSAKEIKVCDWKNGDSTELMAAALRRTTYYVSGNDKIVLFTNGTFELRSGSAVLCTGTYNYTPNRKEIKFVVGDAVFYGSTSGYDVNRPSNISFNFDGKSYVMNVVK